MQSEEEKTPQKQEYAIRFGLGAIKSVGLAAMQEAVMERKSNGKFKSLFDFVERIDPKFINKKSIEALAKSGSFDCLHKNRQQIAGSYEILSSHANQAKEQKESSQMSLFMGSSNELLKPELKKIVDWSRSERLRMEFEAFGFFLNDHPLDSNLEDLGRRGIVFSNRIAEGDIVDNSLIKMAGVVASSKHRSGSRGRFAYLNLSDPFGIFEATIFDEAIITANRDLLNDGSEIVVECLLRSGEGGVRLLVRLVKTLQAFLNEIKPAKETFESIKILPNRSGFNANSANQNFGKQYKSVSENKNFQSSNLNSTNSFHSSNQAADPETVKTSKNKSEKLIVNLKISDQGAFLPLKTILPQKQEKREFTKEAKIFLTVLKDGQEVKIELPDQYYLTEVDLHRFRNLHRGLELNVEQA